jgi:Mn2+/Fe2+ NRAMP family transporter
MGQHVNKPINNIIGWSAVGILIVLTITLLAMPMFNK